jgi:hypothetical protein
MRMLVIKEATDLSALRSRLLNARLSGEQASAALANLQALNPHADLSAVGAGTVLFVPDAPGFKASGSMSVAEDAFGEFQKFVRGALGDAAKRLKDGNAAQAEERDQVAAALRTAAVKRALESDPALKEQIAEASRTFKQEQQRGEQAEEALAEAGKAALAKLTALGKLLG